MKKTTLFVTVVSSLASLFFIPSTGYAQTNFDPATISDASFEAFLPTWEEGLNRFSNGDPALFKQNVSHSADATIFEAFGGYEKGWEKVGPMYDWAASQFKTSGPKLKPEYKYINIIVSGDLAYTAAIAQSVVQETAIEKGAPLRVTEIFRKENGAWKLLHRHADPLIEKKAPTPPLKK